MTDSPATPWQGRRLLEALGRALEGRHPWGTFDIAPAGRTVWIRRRMTVYRPGTNGTERRALAFHRNWPVVGAVVALVTMLPLGAVCPPPIAFSIALMVYFGVFAASAHITRRLRRDSRRLIVVSIAVREGVTTHGDGELLESALAGFARLDRQRREGSLTPAQYERGWSDIYERLEAEPSVDSRARRLRTPES